MSSEVLCCVIRQTSLLGLEDISDRKAKKKDALIPHAIF